MDYTEDKLDKLVELGEKSITRKEIKDKLDKAVETDFDTTVAFFTIIIAVMVIAGSVALIIAICQ